MFWLFCLLIIAVISAVYFHFIDEATNADRLYKKYYKAKIIVDKNYNKQIDTDNTESEISLYSESFKSVTIAADKAQPKALVLTQALSETELELQAEDKPMQQEAEQKLAEQEVEVVEHAERISKLAQYGAQEEMPIALVQDEPMSVLPKDLYIPPEALMVILEAFEGPLDLLLYLIRRQNLDVLDIPIADITKQYMSYIELMDNLDLEVAAEYLLMAAMLAEIKSRMLLPRPEEEDEENDPRAELVRRLQEYERYQKAAEDVAELPRMERDIFPASAEPPVIERRAPEPDVDMKELMIAFQEVLQRADMFTTHHIRREPLSVRERMSMLLAAVSDNNEGFTEFTSLFTAEEGRIGVVVTFLAVLELVKESMIDFVQSEPFAPIYLKPAGSDLEMPVSTSSEFD